MDARIVIDVPLGTTLKEIERLAIEKTLKATGGVAIKAAEALGIKYVTLYRRMAAYGLALKVDEDSLFERTAQK
jgi:DNA-binding NtrC family response regulator